jgi:hypothetical protein
MNRVTIRRFDVVRTATVAAVLYAVITLVFGLLFVLPFALLGGLAASTQDSGTGAAVLGGGLVAGVILVGIGAVFYAVVGWIMTAIVCAIYNWVAGRVGGVRVDVEVDGPWPGGPGYPVPGYAPGYPGAPAVQPAAGQGTLPPPPGWGQPGR